MVGRSCRFWAFSVTDVASLNEPRCNPVCMSCPARGVRGQHAVTTPRKDARGCISLPGLMSHKGPPTDRLPPQKGVVSQIGRLEPEAKAVTGLVSPEGREGESIPDLSLASGRLLATWVSLGVWKHHPGTCLHLYVTFSPCVCVCVCRNFPFFGGRQSCWIEGPPYSSMTSSSQMTSAPTHFQVKVAF